VITPQLRVKEGFIPVPGGKVWYRVVGEGGIPVLCLHGGPGIPHDYLENLEDLADRRMVVFYDQLGCGSSERPDDPSLWTMGRAIEELTAVRERLGRRIPRMASAPYRRGHAGIYAVSYTHLTLPTICSV